MSEEDALLRAICEHPDEDTPRLMFADWLTEQGDPVNTAWANGIRSQVWTAQGIKDHPLVGKALIFDSLYSLKSLQPLLDLPGVTFTSWRRGFPTHAHSRDFAQLCKAWPLIGLRIPFRNLVVSGVTEDNARKFVAWPGLSRLNELEIYAEWRPFPRADILSILAQCRTLSGLKSLKVWSTDVNDAIVVMLLDSPHLAGLETLQLDSIRYNCLSTLVMDRLIARFGEYVGGIPR